jgi:hypothetical protein
MQLNLKPDKAAVAEHNVDSGHCIKFYITSILAILVLYDAVNRNKVSMR